MDVTVALTGYKEIDQVLKGLDQQLNHKILQSAHAAAVKRTVNVARLLAPEGPTGNLIDSIGTIKVPYARSGAIGETHTGPRRGRYKGYAAHLVERGTRKRTLLGKGKYKRGTNRGIMPATPFMKPAWERTKGEVLASIKTHHARALLSYMRRFIKRTGQ